MKKNNATDSDSVTPALESGNRPATMSESILQVRSRSHAVRS